MKNKSSSVIRQQGKELVNRIRTYSLSQQELWRKVPYLALEADGRTGFSDDYALAYTYGLWRCPIRDSSGGYRVGVDLASGKLKELGISGKKPALDEYVIQLASCVDEIEARKIIKNLEEQAKEPYSSCYYPEKQEQWRAGEREKLGLQEQYSRSSRNSMIVFEMDPEAYGLEF